MSATHKAYGFRWWWRHSPEWALVA